MPAPAVQLGFISQPGEPPVAPQPPTYVGGDFPLTSLLDSFDEGVGQASLNPSWFGSAFGLAKGLVPVGPGGPTVNAGVAGGGTGGSAWNNSFLADQEVWVQFATGGVVGGWMSISLRHPSATSTDGYRLQLTTLAGLKTSEWQLQAVVNGAATVLSVFNATISSGDFFGLQAIGSHLRVLYWHPDPGAGTYYSPGDWVELAHVDDGSFTGGGFIGMESNSTHQLHNFGGGSITPDAITVPLPSDVFAQALLLPGQPPAAPLKPSFVGGDFPETPLLDDFNRSDATSLGANWVGTGSIVSNAVKPGLIHVWNNTFLADQECWVDAPSLPLSGGVIEICLRFGSPTLVNGYQLRAQPSNSSWILIKNVAGVLFGIQRFFKSFEAGDSLGLRAIGTSLQVMYRPKGSDWREITRVDDSTFTGGGFIGFRGADTNQRYDNFGGGSINPDPIALPFPPLGAINNPISPNMQLFPSPLPFLVSLPTFPVSSTLDLSYEALQGIAGLDADPWEALGALAATKSDPWEAIVGGIQQTNSESWEALLGVASTKSEIWEALLALASTKSEIWEALLSLASTKSEPWDAIVGGIQQTKSESWEALLGIASTKSDAWEGLQGIAGTKSDPWEANKSLSVTSGYPWEALLAIVKSAGEAWESNQGIAGTKSDPWDATQTISSTKSEPWEALLSINSTKSDIWEAMQGISSTKSGAWEAVQKLAAIGLTPWEAIVGGIVASSSEPWDANLGIAAAKSEVWEALLGIAATKSEPFEALKSIAATASEILEALKSISATPNDPWEASLGITKSTSDIYEALGGIAGTGSEIWEALGNVSSPRSAPWESVLPISQARSEPWEALLAISKTTSEPWTALQGILATGSNPYEAQGHAVVSQTASLIWEALQGLATNPSLPWEALQAITVIKSDPWEALLGISASKADPFEALRSLAVPFGEPWESLLPISGTRSESWEALLGISTTKSEAWEALLGIASIPILPYEAQGEVVIISTASLPYEAIKAISKPSGEAWESLGAITQTTFGPYEALFKLAVTSPEVFEALRGIAAATSLPWDATGVVRFDVSATSVLPYDVLSGIQVVPYLPIDASINLARTSSSPYEANIKVLKVAGALTYEALVKIKNPALLPWETAIGVITKIVVLPWEAGGRLKDIITETGLHLDGTYRPPNFEDVRTADGVHIVVLPSGDYFLVVVEDNDFTIFPLPSQLMEGLTETGLDIGET